MQRTKYLICVVGPTAVGKTSLGIAVATHFGTEIISADSRQFYREMNIGTAKPTAAELAVVKHHFIDSLSIHEPYDVGKFEAQALAKIRELHLVHDVVVMVGGSGLFVNAVCEGFDAMPKIPDGVREMYISKYEEDGLSALQNELEEKDPAYFLIVDKQNPQRLIRALEVIAASGRTFSSFRKRQVVQRPFQMIKIGLHAEREVLYQRIDARMDMMINNGLFDEAERLHPYQNLNALKTVGYTEIFGYLDGLYSKEEAIRLLKRNSRRYAKRQMTWFGKDESIFWFDIKDGTNAILDRIKNEITPKNG